MNIPSILLSISVLLLGGCAATHPGKLVAPQTLFHDAGFAPPAETVSAAQLFALSPEMRRYAHSGEFTALLRHKGAEQGLVDALYKKSELKLEYDASMTRTAAQAFAERAGNCLSLVIMTAAFAKELDMEVRYQEVLVEATWSRSGALYINNSHVNLSIGQRQLDPLRSGFDINRHMLTIDFVTPETLADLPTRTLDESEVVAMYLNNRAAEALAQERLDDAYWWARAAVLQYPNALSAYNTLGVVYQRHGDAQLAEQVYKNALEREPENTMVMNNLEPVLKTLGKAEEAAALAQRLASIEPHPPFHFFNLGMTAMGQGNFTEARRLFAREVKRAPYNHEFHFWLALADWRLGDTAAARDQLRLALDTSTTRDSTQRYSAKLELLRGLKQDRSRVN